MQALGAQPRQRREPGLARHVDVEHDHVGRPLGEQRVEPGRVLGLGDPVALQAQIVGEQRPEVGLVVDDEDPRAGHRAA